MEEFTTGQILDFLAQNEIFHQPPAFSGFLREDLENFLDITQITTVKKGDTVFKKGDKASSIILILKGEVEILLEDSAEKALVISIPGGSFVGEMGIIDESSRSATVVASQDCLLVTIQSQDFWLYFKLYPGLAINLVKAIIRRFKTGSSRNKMPPDSP